MAIKASSFIAIETSLTNQLAKALKASTDSLYKEIAKALKAGDFQQAKELVAKISTDEVFKACGNYIDYSTKLAMLFGASRVTPDPGTSVVGLGHESTMMKNAVQSFSVALGAPARASLKGTAMQLIALAEGGVPEPDPTGLEAIQKAEKPERIIRDFASFMDDAGKAYMNIVSSLHTSRVSAYGFCAEADAMGLAQYQINEQLDTKTCKVCQHMHGKVFDVKHAKALLEVALRAKNPDDLKHIQPWPKQTKEAIAEMRKMSPEELVGSHWHIPPFHPGCRGLLGRSGKVPTLEQVAQGTADAPYEATAEDFKAIGVKVGPAQLGKWNFFANMSPAETIARLQGQPIPEFLSGLMGKEGQELAEYTGLSSFKIGNTVAMKLFSKTPGMAKKVTHGLTLSAPTKRAIITDLSVEGSQLPAETGLEYVRSVVGIARDMSMTSVVAGVGTALEELTAIQAGFLPAQSSWNALRSVLLKELKASPLFAKMGPEPKAKLISALQSPSVALIRDLLSIPEALLLLSGKKWVGTLDLTDAASMKLFLKAMGVASPQ